MRNQIELLDCTLRDGGYLNNWNFGYTSIIEILQSLNMAKIDIVEAGFIREDEYNSDRAVFNSMPLVQNILNKTVWKGNQAKLAVMAEISNPLPLERIEIAEKNNIDIIRVIVWKTKHLPDGKEIDALQESYEYCKGMVERGYKLCVQPNRADQYSDEEFTALLKRFSTLSPMAIYVVDSWGTMYSDQVIHYMDLAHKILPAEIAIGFHGHNNMMQAFSTAEKIVQHNYDRKIILDASVYGIGRGAGNLNLELIARFLNKTRGCSYDIGEILQIYDQYIKPLSKKYDWGSSVPYFLSADTNSNPNYASDFTGKLDSQRIAGLFKKMTRNDAVMYSKKLSEKYLMEGLR